MGTADAPSDPVDVNDLSVFLAAYDAAPEATRHLAAADLANVVADYLHDLASGVSS